MMRSERTDANCVTIYFDEPQTEYEKWILVSSDRHHDNIHCRQDLEKRHLDEALKRNALIIDIGDLFCAMQGKYDKRSDKSSLRPEHKEGEYLDTLVKTAAQFYAPYAKNIIILGKGNHERGIKKNHETDLTERLAGALIAKSNSHIHVMGIDGWVRFCFSAYGNERGGKKLWFTHGYGGGGPVTEDIIQSNRQRVYIENADIMLSGHVHRSWQLDFVRMYCDISGKIQRKIGWYLKLPTYKDAYGTGGEGFEQDNGHGPRPLGAWWLRFLVRRDKRDELPNVLPKREHRSWRIEVEVSRAQE